jgi:hypothetical protein
MKDIIKKTHEWFLCINGFLQLIHEHHLKGCVWYNWGALSKLNQHGRILAMFRYIFAMFDENQKTGIETEKTIHAL